MAPAGSSVGHDPVAGRVVVVGGGAAGAAVVRTLLKAPAPPPVVLLTAEPHAPYDRTMLSKPSLLSASDEAPQPKPLLGDADDRVQLRTGVAVEAIDRAAHEVVTARGERIGYDHLVLATGSSPRTLPLPGADLPFVHALRELHAWGALRDAVRGPGPLVVVGGGLIGLEVAAAVREQARDVTVVEAADRLMGRVLPAAVADLLADEHQGRGVRLELGVRPTAIVAAGDGAVGGVQLADGRVLPARAVLISVGAVPRLDLAAAAGLELDHGVVVDRWMQTSDPAILAAGDIVRIRSAGGMLTPRTEAWTPAVAMGQQAARTIAGVETGYDDVPWMWSDQYDLRLQAAGAPVAEVEQVVRGTLDDPGGLVVFGLVEGRIVGVAGMSRGNGVGRTVRAAQALVQHGVTVDPAVLADPTSDLRALRPRAG